MDVVLKARTRDIIVPVNSTRLYQHGRTRKTGCRARSPHWHDPRGWDRKGGAPGQTSAVCTKVSLKADTAHCSQAAERVLLNTKGIPKPSFVPLQAGFELFQKTGVALPQETVDTLRAECTGAMFGAVSSPSHKVEGYSSPIVKLRKELDLYANIRPINSVPGAPGRQVEMTVVRENTECLYVKQETIEDDPKLGRVARATRQITKRASERIGKMAGEVALRGEEVRSKLPESQRVWKVRYYLPIRFRACSSNPGTCRDLRR